MADYREFAATPALAAHVHCLWQFEGFEAGVEQAVPPDGRCELIVHLGQPYEELGHDDGRWHVQAPSFFAGQLTRPLVLRSRGEVAVLAVRFQPAGARAFAGRSLAACTDRRIELVALHGAAAATQLAADLAAADPPAARLDVLAAYVQRRIASSAERRDVAIERCIERLYADEGRVSTAELVALVGLSPRQLQRRFADVVGVSPRQLAGIVRLRRVFDALREEPLANWSALAQAAGFFDHPQMGRDFKRLLGRSPVRWSAAGPGLAASLAGQADAASQRYKPAS